MHHTAQFTRGAVSDRHWPRRSPARSARISVNKVATCGTQAAKITGEIDAARRRELTVFRTRQGDRWTVRLVRLAAEPR